ncbi:MAG: hypothetical protein O7D30_05765, partial [Rickettsia endosymbiont of Ixodes persulcatus]|nr:hypothetical protein [Rickettsia endosymbiont of Ixodes persulcatus]
MFFFLTLLYYLEGGTFLWRYFAFPFIFHHHSLNLESLYGHYSRWEYLLRKTLYKGTNEKWVTCWRTLFYKAIKTGEKKNICLETHLYLFPKCASTKSQNF